MEDSGCRKIGAILDPLFSILRDLYGTSSITDRLSYASVISWQR